MFEIVGVVFGQDWHDGNWWLGGLLAMLDLAAWGQGELAATLANAIGRSGNETRFHGCISIWVMTVSVMKPLSAGASVNIHRVFRRT